MCTHNSFTLSCKTESINTNPLTLFSPVLVHSLVCKRSSLRRWRLPPQSRSISPPGSWFSLFLEWILLISWVIPSSPITWTPFSSPLPLAYIVDKSLKSLEFHLDAISSSSYCPVFLLSFSCRNYSNIYFFFHHFLYSLFNLLQSGLFPWEQFSFTTSLSLIFSDFPSWYHQDLFFFLPVSKILMILRFSVYSIYFIWEKSFCFKVLAIVYSLKTSSMDFFHAL